MWLGTFIVAGFLAVRMGMNEGGAALVGAITSFVPFLLFREPRMASWRAVRASAPLAAGTLGMCGTQALVADHGARTTHATPYVWGSLLGSIGVGLGAFLVVSVWLARRERARSGAAHPSAFGNEMMSRLSQLGRRAMTETSALLLALAPVVVVVAAIAGLFGAYGWFERREADARVWEAWRREACVQIRIDTSSWGQRRTCSMCKPRAALLLRAEADPRLSARLHELGGALALRRGIEVCE